MTFDSGARLLSRDSGTSLAPVDNECLKKGELTVADLATSSAKDNFQPWKKSPCLHELVERLEAEGFK